MRKILTLTAALAAAVIFFVVATLPPAPRRLAAGDSALARRTIAGAVHVHTGRSDGAGDRAAVAAAAARAGLGFVIVTDHGDATRTPDAPAYLDGVLCLDAVEISTNQGHYLTLGMGPAPYPLGGEASAVVEDVARLGGFGIAAHPDSTRPELAWSDWSAPLDGLEWLNADSEWRNEPRSRLARVLFDYPLRPASALASMLDRPAAIARWDALTADRPVVAIAGHDAHGGIGRGAEYRTAGKRSNWPLPGVPSYEASFRTFSTRVILSAPPTGDADADAAELLHAIRSGRVFTAVDALAGPAVLEFVALRGDRRIEMGETAPPGPATFVARLAAAPPGGRIVLLRNGVEIAAADGNALRKEWPAANGAYRIEVRIAGAPGDPPVPWVLANPIYFRQAGEPRAALVSAVRTTAPAVPLPREVSWQVEKDRGSTASVVPSGNEVVFFYKLRGPGRGSQYAAAVADLQERAPSGEAVVFTASAVRPARVSVQLRYRRGGGQRWGRSVYLDATPRDVRVPIADLLPIDRQSGPAPEVSRAMSLMFVADLTNALPGAANTMRLSKVGIAR